MSYHFAAVTRQGGRAEDAFPTAEPFCDGLEGSSGILGPRGNNYPPPTLGYGKNLPPQTHLTLSQLESNIRKKMSPAEADNHLSWPHPPQTVKAPAATSRSQIA